MAEFHPFLRLPFELRTQIWEETVEPRVVDVQMIPVDPLAKLNPPPVCYMKSSTPVPAPLQTCREARNAQLYQKGFTEVAHPGGLGQQYIWLNLDIDTISIGPAQAKIYRQAAHSVQRLKIERHYLVFGFVLPGFDSLKELYIVAAGGMWQWYREPQWGYWWAHIPENIWFIDPDDGRMINAAEMLRVFKRDESCSTVSQRDRYENAKKLMSFTIYQAN
ncbi:hypothetical protein E8E13_006534 [Curvularia kusanoi]|uniref:2EXR domain-containing protein n=1 Tax=Curvularia kusanoi TaxID=90978 RepID=A0A9P4TAH7_CURKU|nr:hypothetical protein E8E13_006534 [Curvularia kusanoi]